MNQNLVEILFDSLSNSVQYFQDSVSFPPSDIITTPDKDYIKIVLAVAGFKKSDIKLEVKDEFITVSGKMPDNQESKEYYIKHSLRTREFARKFILSDGYWDISSTDAVLEDGLLTITLKKNPALVNARKVIELK